MKNMFILLTYLMLTSCSNNDSTEPNEKVVLNASSNPTCFLDEGRAVVATFENAEGTIIGPGSESCPTIFTIRGGPDIPERVLDIVGPCNLPDEFKENERTVIFSGFLFETFETEDVCAQPFEITEITLK